MNEQNNIECPKISIIIPFYNLENYVSKCLESVLSQDMPDFEIIAVNDGSTDSTPALLEEYAKKNERIRVVHLENGGPSWARNQGVKKATGEYIMFVDGDDFILPNALSELYNYAQSNNADVVIFSYIPWQNGVFDSPHKFSYSKDKAMDALTATKLMLIDCDPTVWNKIIRRVLYLEKKICFPEGMLCEDGPVSCAILINSNRIVYFDKHFYVYVARDTSTMRSPATFKRTHDFVRSYELILEEIKKSGYERELAVVFDFRYIDILSLQLRMCYSRPEQYKSPEELKKTKIFLEKCFSKISIKQILSNPHLKLSAKIKALRLKSGVYNLEKIIERYFK